MSYEFIRNTVSIIVLVVPVVLAEVVVVVAGGVNTGGCLITG